MASTDEIEVEGETTFALTSNTSYRYIIKMKNDKMSIWMENQTSKKQWYKGKMAKDDYMTPSNSISNLSAMDYLKCFQDSLDGKLDESGDAHRTLEMLKGGALQIVFDFKFHFLDLARVTRFEFVLDPISVKLMDVLESKVCDQQNELKEYREELKRDRGELERHYEELERLRGDISAYVKLTTSTKKDAATSYLLWSDIDSEIFAVNSETGKVSTQRPGIYSITAVVSLRASNQNQLVELMKNGTTAQSGNATFGIYNTISITIRFEASDFVAVKCDCYVEEAFLSIAYLRCS